MLLHVSHSTCGITDRSRWSTMHTEHSGPRNGYDSTPNLRLGGPSFLCVLHDRTRERDHIREVKSQAQPACIHLMEELSDRVLNSHAFCGIAALPTIHRITSVGQPNPSCLTDIFAGGSFLRANRSKRIFQILNNPPTQKILARRVGSSRCNGDDDDPGYA
jgi:hypothetical protein